MAALTFAPASKAQMPCALIQSDDGDGWLGPGFPPIGGRYFGFWLGELTGEGKALNVRAPPENPLQAQ